MTKPLQNNISFQVQNQINITAQQQQSQVLSPATKPPLAPMSLNNTTQQDNVKYPHQFLLSSSANVKNQEKEYLTLQSNADFFYQTDDYFPSGKLHNNTKTTFKQGTQKSASSSRNQYLGKDKSTFDSVRSDNFQHQQQEGLKTSSSNGKNSEYNPYYQHDMMVGSPTNTNNDYHYKSFNSQYFNVPNNSIYTTTHHNPSWSIGMHSNSIMSCNGPLPPNASRCSKVYLEQQQQQQQQYDIAMQLSPSNEDQRTQGKPDDDNANLHFEQQGKSTERQDLQCQEINNTCKYKRQQVILQMDKEELQLREIQLQKERQRLKRRENKIAQLREQFAKQYERQKNMKKKPLVRNQDQDEGRIDQQSTSYHLQQTAKFQQNQLKAKAPSSIKKKLPNLIDYNDYDDEQGQQKQNSNLFLKQLLSSQIGSRRNSSIQQPYSAQGGNESRRSNNASSCVYVPFSARKQRRMSIVQYLDSKENQQKSKSNPTAKNISTSSQKKQLDNQQSSDKNRYADLVYDKFSKEIKSTFLQEISQLREDFNQKFQMLQEKKVDVSVDIENKDQSKRGQSSQDNEKKVMLNLINNGPSVIEKQKNLIQPHTTYLPRQNYINDNRVPYSSQYRHPRSNDVSPYHNRPYNYYQQHRHHQEQYQQYPLYYDQAPHKSAAPTPSHIDSQLYSYSAAQNKFRSSSANQIGSKRSKLLAGRATTHLDDRIDNFSYYLPEKQMMKEEMLKPERDFQVTPTSTVSTVPRFNGQFNNQADPKIQLLIQQNKKLKDLYELQLKKKAKRRAKKLARMKEKMQQKQNLKNTGQFSNFSSISKEQELGKPQKFKFIGPYSMESSSVCSSLKDQRTSIHSKPPQPPKLIKSTNQKQATTSIDTQTSPRDDFDLNKKDSIATPIHATKITQDKQIQQSYKLEYNTQTEKQQQQNSIRIQRAQTVIYPQSKNNSLSHQQKQMLDTSAQYQYRCRRKSTSGKKCNYSIDSVAVISPCSTQFYDVMKQLFAQISTQQGNNQTLHKQTMNLFVKQLYKRCGYQKSLPLYDQSLNLLLNNRSIREIFGERNTLDYLVILKMVQSEYFMHFTKPYFQAAKGQNILEETVSNKVQGQPSVSKYIPSKNLNNEFVSMKEEQISKNDLADIKDRKILETEYHHNDSRNISRSMSDNRSSYDRLHHYQISNPQKVDFHKEQAKADRATITAAVDRFKIAMSGCHSRSNSSSGANQIHVTQTTSKNLQPQQLNKIQTSKQKNKTGSKLQSQLQEAYQKAHQHLNKSSQSLKYYNKYNKSPAITPIRTRKTEYNLTQNYTPFTETNQRTKNMQAKEFNLNNQEKSASRQRGNKSIYDATNRSQTSAIISQKQENISIAQNQIETKTPPHQHSTPSISISIPKGDFLFQDSSRIMTQNDPDLSTCMEIMNQKQQQKLQSAQNQQQKEQIYDYNLNQQQHHNQIQQYHPQIQLPPHQYYQNVQQLPQQNYPILQQQQYFYQPQSPFNGMPMILTPQNPHYYQQQPSLNSTNTVPINQQTTQQSIFLQKCPQQPMYIHTTADSISSTQPSFQPLPSSNNFFTPVNNNQQIDVSSVSSSSSSALNNHYFPTVTSIKAIQAFPPILSPSNLLPMNAIVSSSSGNNQSNNKSNNNSLLINQTTGMDTLTSFSIVPSARDILRYAKTPPRPVLSQEMSLTLIQLMATNSIQFTILKKLFTGGFCQSNAQSSSLNRWMLSKVIKTYTYSQHRKLQKRARQRQRENQDLNNKQKQQQSQNDDRQFLVLLHYGRREDLQEIAKHNKGFQGVYGLKQEKKKVEQAQMLQQKIQKIKNLTFCNDLRSFSNYLDRKQSEGDRYVSVLATIVLAKNSVIECNSDIDEYFNDSKMIKIYERANMDGILFRKQGIYLSLDTSNCVPSYILEFNLS